VLLLISVAVDPRLNYVFLQAMIDFQEAKDGMKLVEPLCAIYG